MDNEPQKPVVGRVKRSFQIPFGKKGLAAVILLLGVLILAGLLFWPSHKKSDQNSSTNPETLPLVSVSNEEITEALNTVTATGKVISVDASKLVITLPDSSKETFNFTPETKITRGAEDKEASIQDIKPGMQVDISYSKDNKHILGVWFE